MDRVVDLTTIVQTEVADYADARGWKSNLFYVKDDQHHIYTVIVVPNEDHPLMKRAGVSVMARIVEGYVVIDVDMTDRPLYEALMRAGIPREQIVLAYAGEKPPDEKDETE